MVACCYAETVGQSNRDVGVLLMSGVPLLPQPLRLGCISSQSKQSTPGRSQRMLQGAAVVGCSRSLPTDAMSAVWLGCEAACVAGREAARKT